VDVLVPEALKLMKDEEKKQSYSQNIRKLGKPDAATTIAKEVVRIMDEYRKR